MTNVTMKLEQSSVAGASVPTNVRTNLLCILTTPELEQHIAGLDKNIALKVADHLRLSPGYGPNGVANWGEQFLNSLSTAEFETFNKWWRGLSRDAQDAILVGVSK